MILRFNIFIIFFMYFSLQASVNEQLRNGELVIIEKSADVVNSYKLMEITKDDFWKVITNYSNQKNFMPNVSKSEILKNEDGSIFVSMQLSIMFNDIDYILKMKEDKDNYSISWVQEKGDFIRNVGGWKVEYFDDTHVKVSYFLDVKYSSGIPSFIRNYLTRKSIPKVFDAIEKEVKKN